jgi:hypothetical protein
MGGKTTNQYITNVTETGLGDSQYSGIMSGQGTITGNQAGLKTDIGAVQSGQEAGFGNVQGGFDALNTYLGEQFKTAGTNRTGLADTQLAATNTAADAAKTREALATTARTNMGTAIDTGFEDMGGRFDTVDTNVGNVQTAVDTGFVDQAAGFADAQVNREAASLAAQTDRDTQFAATGAALDTGFANTVAGQTSLLEGQTGLGTDLDAMSTAQDTYAAQSLANQDSIQSGIDTAASTFDTYADRYSDDQSLAQDTRQDMATAQSNFANKLSADVANYNNNVGRDLEGLQGQVDSVLDQQTANASNMAAAAAQMTNLDANTRANFQALGAAFDNSGALISESTDEAGNKTARAYDNMGNIVLTTFNAAGAQTGQNSIGIQPALNNLSKLQMGANAQTGNLSPAGLASPFAVTS